MKQIKIKFDKTHNEKSVFDTFLYYLKFPYGWACWDSMQDLLEGMEWLDKETTISIIVTDEFEITPLSDLPIFVDTILYIEKFTHAHADEKPVVTVEISKSILEKAKEIPLPY